MTSFTKILTTYFVPGTSKEVCRLLPIDNFCDSSLVPVATCLRSLWSDDPLNKGHPRSIEQGLEL